MRLKIGSVKLFAEDPNDVAKQLPLIFGREKPINDGFVLSVGSHLCVSQRIILPLDAIKGAMDFTIRKVSRVEFGVEFGEMEGSLGTCLCLGQA